jgi:ATP-dependent RNA helicase RhlE
VLSGRDLLGAAQTGTGKTAGFTLPMLQRFSAQADTSASPARHPIRALILVPTRELAAQVQESVRAYGRHLKLRSTVVFGGVGFNPQADELRRGVDILVATPGRLLDHVEQRTVDLRHVEILVLDEADRMLDMGFIPDVRRILKLLPAKRQNLLFSATFPDEIRSLAASFMHDPVTVEVAPRNRPVELISQAAYPVHREGKRDLLAHLVKTGNWEQVLVFTRTKHGANRLAHQLSRAGIEADAIHGNKSQGARTRALKRFKDNELRVLVATDIAARGLDIEDLPHVVNYDLPHVAEDYVHRIGRTGRAGASGEAVSLVAHEERPLLAAIERLIGRKIEQRTAEGVVRLAPAHEPAHQQQHQEGQPEPREHRQQPQGQPRQHTGEARDTAAPGNAPGGNGKRRRRRRGGRGAGADQRQAQQPRHDRQPQHQHNGNRVEQQAHGEIDGNRIDYQPRRQPERQQPRRGQQRQQFQRGQERQFHRGQERQRPRGQERQQPQQPRVAAYGQYAPQHPHQQPVPPAQAQRKQDDDRQPSPEKAKNQLFPAFFGLFSRKGR